jgi:hypothetical protein
MHRTDSFTNAVMAATNMLPLLHPPQLQIKMMHKDNVLLPWQAPNGA